MGLPDVASEAGQSWRSDNGRKLELRCGDILRLGRHWHAATVAYVSSLCFPDELMSALALQLDQCPRLLWVASLKMFPSCTLSLESVQRWPMSWTTPVYIYKRLQHYPLCSSLLEEPAF